MLVPQFKIHTNMKYGIIPWMISIASPLGVTCTPPSSKTIHSFAQIIRVVSLRYLAFFLRLLCSMHPINADRCRTRLATASAVVKRSVWAFSMLWVAPSPLMPSLGLFTFQYCRALMRPTTASTFFKN